MPSHGPNNFKTKTECQKKTGTNKVSACAICQKFDRSNRFCQIIQHNEPTVSSFVDTPSKVVVCLHFFLYAPDHDMIIIIIEEI